MGFDVIVCSYEFLGASCRDKLVFLGRMQEYRNKHKAGPVYTLSRRPTSALASEIQGTLDPPSGLAAKSKNKVLLCAPPPVLD